jgi:hypothetical protein
MNSDEMGFCNSSRTGKGIRFRNRHIEVRLLPPQPPIPAFSLASQETREPAGNPGFLRIRFCFRVPGLPNLSWKSPKVSGLVRKYSRFAETIGGDWFDHDCRPSTQSISATNNLLSKCYKWTIG